jgi:transposase InsO family protein
MQGDQAGCPTTQVAQEALDTARSGFKKEFFEPSSFEAVEFATLTWVDWFNHRRLLEPIGNIPPAEAEERYYAMLDEPAIAA